MRLETLILVVYNNKHQEYEYNKNKRIIYIWKTNWMGNIRMIILFLITGISNIRI